MLPNMSLSPTHLRDRCTPIMNSGFSIWWFATQSEAERRHSQADPPPGALSIAGTSPHRSQLKCHLPPTVILCHSTLSIFFIALCNSFIKLEYLFLPLNTSPMKEGAYGSYFPRNLQGPSQCWLHGIGLINIHGIIVCIINEERNIAGQTQLISEAASRQSPLCLFWK